VSIGGGASTVQQALAAGLLDELQISIVPLLLRGGVRLFEDLPAGIELQTTRVIEGPGVAHVRYEVVT
jgi:dihydrofolate reductase